MDFHPLSRSFLLDADLIIFFAGCFIVLILLQQLKRIDEAIQYEEWLNSLPG